MVGIPLAVVQRMDLWIGVEDRGDVREVRLEGRLAEVSIAELERATLGLEPPIRFDLSQLLSTDEVGLSVLRAHQAAGRDLVGVRPLIRHLLTGPAVDRGPENDR